jgi:hypothetical protein
MKIGQKRWIHPYPRQRGTSPDPRFVAHRTENSCVGNTSKSLYDRISCTRPRPRRPPPSASTFLPKQTCHFIWKIAKFYVCSHVKPKFHPTMLLPQSFHPGCVQNGLFSKAPIFHISSMQSPGNTYVFPMYFTMLNQYYIIVYQLYNSE